MKNKNPILLRLGALGLLAVLLAGCNTTTITKTAPDGEQFTARNSRVFWSSEGVAVDFKREGANVSASARIKKSGPDAEAIEAAARGGASGAR